MGNRFSLMDVACVTQNFNGRSPRLEGAGRATLCRDAVSSLRLIIASCRKDSMKMYGKCSSEWDPCLLPVNSTDDQARSSGLKRRAIFSAFINLKQKIASASRVMTGVGVGCKIFHFALIIAQRFAINS